MKIYVHSRLYLVIVTVHYWSTLHCEVRAEVKETVGDLNMEFDCKFIANMRRNVTALLCKTPECTFKTHTKHNFIVCLQLFSNLNSRDSNRKNAPEMWICTVRPDDPAVLVCYRLRFVDDSSAPAPWKAFCHQSGGHR
jgi:hypothetical protein